MDLKNYLTSTHESFLSALPELPLKKIFLKILTTIFIGTIFSFIFIFAGLILSYFLKFPSHLTRSLGIFLQDLPFLLLILFLFYKNNVVKTIKDLFDRNLTNKFRLLLVVLDLLLLILCYLFIYIYQIIQNKENSISMFKGITDSGIDTLSIGYFIGLGLGFITMLFIAFSEEFIFRHTIYRFLRKYGIIFSIIVTSLLFHLIHGQIFHIGFLLSVVFCLYYEYTNDFKGIVIVHALNNLLVSFITFYLAHIFLLILG